MKFPTGSHAQASQPTAPCPVRRNPRLGSCSTQASPASSRDSASAVCPGESATPSQGASLQHWVCPSLPTSLQRLCCPEGSTVTGPFGGVGAAPVLSLYLRKEWSSGEFLFLSQEARPDPSDRATRLICWQPPFVRALITESCRCHEEAGRCVRPSG